MRIAMIVGAFPELSTTFVLDQITGLLDRGHDVQVFARVPTVMGPVHDDFVRYRLAERTHYWWGRGQVAPFAKRLARLAQRDPAGTLRVAIKASNPIRYGSYALTARYLSYASKMLESGPFDVVLAQFGTYGRDAEFLREMGAFTAPCATLWRGYDLTRIVREKGTRHYRRLLAQGGMQLPLSEYFRSLLLQLGAPAERIHIVRVGVDLSRFSFSLHPLEAGQIPRIVTVCRLVEKKGLAFALDALARVRDRGLAFEYHLAGDGPLRPALEAQCQRLGLAPRVVMHGGIDRARVRALLASSHLFLSPSVTGRDGDQEGTPTAIMEAMASGLPVISTVHSSIPEVVSDGVSGFTVAEWDVPALADRVAFLLEHPEKWESFARAGRSIVERDYDGAKINDQLSALLIQLARSASAPSAARR